MKKIAFIVYEACMCKRTLQNHAKRDKNGYRVHIYSIVANFTFLFCVWTFKNEVIIRECAATFPIIQMFFQVGHLSPILIFSCTCEKSYWFLVNVRQEIMPESNQRFFDIESSCST